MTSWSFDVAVGLPGNQQQLQKVTVLNQKITWQAHDSPVKPNYEKQGITCNSCRGDGYFCHLLTEPDELSLPVSTLCA